MKQTIEQFYKAFANLDAQAMVDCYHEDIVFHDPAFGELRGERAKNMWRMLCSSQQGKDFRVKYSNIENSENQGSAQWEAFYTFSKSGRPVHNVISAQFELVDGKIFRHADEFNFYSWSKQALGPIGFLLGWTLFFKRSFQKKANSLLDRIEAARA